MRQKSMSSKDPAEKVIRDIRRKTRKRYSAEVEWETLRAAHRDLLGSLNVTLQPADLGAEMGVVHRLVVGSFETKVTARAFCAQLKQRNVDCFVQQRS